MVRLFGVSKAYRKESSALNGVSFRISKGEFVYITGPSGAGKSTLMKLLYCAERPTRGQVLLDGQNVTRLPARKVPYLRRRLGVVFQDYKLLENRTVFENVAFPLEVQGMKRYEVSRKVYDILELVGMEHKLKSRPLELSGGEQQRVSIARALIVDPMLLMADEPTGNLDSMMSREIVELFSAANAKGATVLLATHDRDIMQHMPGRVISLEAGSLVNDSHPTPVGFDEV
jgi:cell division transport system ATP-binding protein